MLAILLLGGVASAACDKQGYRCKPGDAPCSNKNCIQCDKNIPAYKVEAAELTDDKKTAEGFTYKTDPKGEEGNIYLDGEKAGEVCNCPKDLAGEQMHWHTPCDDSESTICKKGSCQCPKGETWICVDDKGKKTTTCNCECRQGFKRDTLGQCIACDKSDSDGLKNGRECHCPLKTTEDENGITKEETDTHLAWENGACKCPEDQTWTCDSWDFCSCHCKPGFFKHEGKCTECSMKNPQITEEFLGTVAGQICNCPEVNREKTWQVIEKKGKKEGVCKCPEGEKWACKGTNPKKCGCEACTDSDGGTTAAKSKAGGQLCNCPLKKDEDHNLDSRKEGKIHEAQLAWLKTEKKCECPLDQEWTCSCPANDGICADPKKKICSCTCKAGTYFVCKCPEDKLKCSKNEETCGCEECTKDSVTPDGISGGSICNCGVKGTGKDRKQRSWGKCETEKDTNGKDVTTCKCFDTDTTSSFVFPIAVTLVLLSLMAAALVRRTAAAQKGTNVSLFPPDVEIAI